MKDNKTKKAATTDELETHFNLVETAFENNLPQDKEEVKRNSQVVEYSPDNIINDENENFTMLSKSLIDMETKICL